MSCETFTKDICGRRNDFKYPYVFTFSDGVNPIDISGMEFYIELRKNSGTSIAYKLGDGLTIVDKTLIWNFGNKLDVAEGNWSYAIKMVEADKPRTIISGKFIIKPEIVREYV